MVDYAYWVDSGRIFKSAPNGLLGPGEAYLSPKIFFNFFRAGPRISGKYFPWEIFYLKLPRNLPWVSQSFPMGFPWEIGNPMGNLWVKIFPMGNPWAKIFPMGNLWEKIFPMGNRKSHGKFWNPMGFRFPMGNPWEILSIKITQPVEVGKSLGNWS